MYCGPFSCRQPAALQALFFRIRQGFYAYNRRFDASKSRKSVETSDKITLMLKINSHRFKPEEEKTEEDN